jgi:hypothetical protein
VFLKTEVTAGRDGKHPVEYLSRFLNSLRLLINLTLALGLDERINTSSILLLS